MYTRDSIAFAQEDSLFVLALYDSLWQNCLRIQSTCVKSPCDEKLELLKMDVSPGSQYALYDSANYTLLEASINVLAQRGSIAFFVDETGKRDSVTVVNSAGEEVLTDVKNLPDSLFIRYFKSSWGDSLVRLHRNTAATCGVWPTLVVTSLMRL
ncbi:hypothetical protein [Paraflavitalea speifideaquila]|uniref:hypothetical protein n=1 Tax=Paraflavitalea speifideaquila TaxID=3076558 RepID=UPI0028EB0B4B|nr:hypothetical protein [Paraflavitalea speifideiaquila]